jgi:Ca2+-binding RTX toxin-like protein
MSITVSVEDAWVGEGDGVAQLLVRLSGPSADPVSVTWRTRWWEYVEGRQPARDDYSYATELDYAYTEGLLTFAPGEVLKSISVPLYDDTAAEFAEAFQVELRSPSGATLGRSRAAVTIVDDDTVAAVPVVTVSDVVVDEKAGWADLVVRLDAAAAGTVSVNYATVDGTALAGSDYGAVSGVLAFAPGEMVKTVRVALLDDAVAEGAETFRLALSNAQGATLAQAQARVVIAANDGPVQATPTISVEDAWVGEGDGVAQLLVRLSGPAVEPVSVTWRTRWWDYVEGRQPARDGYSYSTELDYSYTDGSLTFAPGEVLKSISVPLFDDAVAEQSEAFQVELRFPSGATLGRSRAAVTIVDDDVVKALPVITVSDLMVDEKAGWADLIVRLDAAAAGTVSAAYATLDGTAVAGSDYAAENGVLTFAPGEVVKTVRVVLLDDAVAEAAETFRLALSNVQGATLGQAQAQVVIAANDGPAQATPVISVEDAWVGEGDGVAQVLVRLSGPSASSVSVNWRTSWATAGAYSVGQTARDGYSFSTDLDFSYAEGQLTFAPGEVLKTISVPLYADTVAEQAETFRVQLLYPVNATMQRAFATATILDDDAAPPAPRVPGHVSDGFLGREIRVETFGSYLQHGYDLIVPQVRTVSDTLVEYQDLSSFGLYHSSQIPATIDIGRASITYQITSTAAGTFYAASFNGIRISDADGLVPAIVGVTIDSATNSLGITPERVMFDGNDIAVNVQGLPYQQGQGFTLHVDFGSGGTPSQQVWTITPQAATVDEIDGEVLHFIITRPDAASAGTVYVSTVKGPTGTINDDDYDGLLNFRVDFASGETTAPFAVTIRGDTNLEGNETFGVIVQANASDPVSTFLASATFTIIDDEPRITAYPIKLPFSPQHAYRITQGFDDLPSHQNYNSGGGQSGLKWGVDFGMPYGSDVLAMHGGRIVAFRQSIEKQAENTPGTGHGNYVTIESNFSGNLVYMTYGHLEKDFLKTYLDIHHAERPLVRDANQIATSWGEVHQGQLIAKIGETGYRTAAHLHVHVGTKTIYHGTAGEYVASGLDDVSWPVYFETLGDILIKDTSDAIIGDNTSPWAGGPLDDLITGTDVNDYLSGGDGNDILRGGAGNDTLDGGDGDDTADYADAPGRVVVDLTITGPQNTLGGERDTLISIENLVGTAFNDTLRGNAADNRLEGGAGNDTIEGRDGNDSLDGGVGTDTAEYRNATAGVSVSLLLQGTPQDTRGAGLDLLSNFENLTGSMFDDTLVGDGQNNILRGLDGDDILEGGAGNDLLDGGAGIDLASYAGAPSAVKVYLNSASATGSAGTDYFVSIEGFLGSDFNDTLVGNAAANVLRGGAGNDRLFGLEGDDILRGGPGDDILYGGPGNDTADYSDATVTVRALLGINATVNTTNFGRDRYFDIENLAGGSARDFLTGDGNANTIWGNGGNDIIDGGAGDDTLFGGEGNDDITGGPGADLIDLGPAAGNDIVRYVAAADSRAAAMDRIVGFTASGPGFDRILFESAPGALCPGVAPTSITLGASVAVASASSIADLVAQLGSLTASTAASLAVTRVDVAAGGAAGSYLIVNDTAAAFDPTSDMLIGIQFASAAALGAGNLLLF